MGPRVIHVSAFQREKICLCNGCFHWKKSGADVCVREVVGEDLEPTERGLKICSF